MNDKMSQLLKSLDKEDIELLKAFFESEEIKPSSEEKELKEKTEKLDKKLLEGLSLSKLLLTQKEIEKTEIEQSNLSEKELIALFYLKKAEIIREVRKLQLILDKLRRNRENSIVEDFFFENELRAGNVISILRNIDILPLTLPDRSYISFDCNEKEKEEIYKALDPKENIIVSSLFSSPGLRINELHSQRYSWKFYEIYDTVSNENCAKHTLIRDDSEGFKIFLGALINGIISEIGEDFITEINSKKYIFYYKKDAKEKFSQREWKDEIKVKVSYFEYKIPSYVQEGDSGGLMVSVYHKDWLLVLYKFIAERYKSY